MSKERDRLAAGQFPEPTADNLAAGKDCLPARKFTQEPRAVSPTTIPDAEGVLSISKVTGDEDRIVIQFNLNNEPAEERNLRRVSVDLTLEEFAQAITGQRTPAVMKSYVHMPLAGYAGDILPDACIKADADLD